MSLNTDGRVIYVTPKTGDIQFDICQLKNEKLQQVKQLINSLHSFLGDGLYFKIHERKNGFIIEYHRSEIYEFTATAYSASVDVENEEEDIHIECVESEDGFLFKSVFLFNRPCDVEIIFDRNYTLKTVSICHISFNLNKYCVESKFSLFFNHSFNLTSLIEYRCKLAHTDPEFKPIASALFMYRLSEFLTNPVICDILPELWVPGVYDFNSVEFNERLLTLDMYLL